MRDGRSSVMGFILVGMALSACSQLKVDQPADAAAGETAAGPSRGGPGAVDPAAPIAVSPSGGQGGMSSDSGAAGAGGMSPSGPSGGAGLMGMGGDAATGAGGTAGGLGPPLDAAGGGGGAPAPPDAADADAPPDCKAGAVRCTGNLPESCSSSGNWIAGQPCTTICREGKCTECSPGEKRCRGSQTAQTCSSDGRYVDSTTCASGCQTCNGGACVDRDNGTGCGGGKVCRGGACVTCQMSCGPIGCTTRTLDCSSGTARCVDTGTVKDGGKCGNGMVCKSGVCHPCSAGSDCSNGNPCVTAQIVCDSGDPICDSKPRDGRCGKPQSCSGDGNITFGQVCQGGSCVDPTPGGMHCGSGTCTGDGCGAPPACGGNKEPCCGGQACNAGLSCRSGTCTLTCGEEHQRCCPPPDQTCAPGLTCTFVLAPEGTCIAPAPPPPPPP
jgi:hypothetical protein